MTETNAKIKAPAKKNKENKKEKIKAAAFMNWAVQLKSGKLFKGSKGLPVFQNPEYQNDHEDWLIELARKNGGVIELPMMVTIRINDGKVEMPSIKDVI